MAKDQHKEEARAETHAVIDRIEEELAVLLVGDDEKTRVDVPLSLLPKGVKDGDHLRIQISLDRPSRAASEDRIKKLQDELKAQSGTAEKKEFKL